ncbi:extracellular solute-binding protein [Exercitatus varius]|uniref:Extracellular solute-binding protein n=1 Tax=Exercitatus varius TaxID=67857 RepID=A0AAW6QDP2_9PAST|nr:extracellular solute-binding protein [Exercitatus varius]MDG2941377.1 extracellular solute-binding protein [Exercitatus varius]MDG2950502.1 extracellular solute-binding protein [Exercitatus varius]MDG2957918.1 extracellular solute-binding protein [Exercitatus varius]QOF68507.1 extracellular solute-binding protein [Actinobacillus sp. GY-402]
MRKIFTKLFSATVVAFAFSTAVQAEDLSGKSWADIEAQAKREGKVTVSVWYLQPQFRGFVKEFENKYGIKVKVPEGTQDGNINKLIAEKNLEKGKMDVIALNADRVANVANRDILISLKQLPNFEKLNHFLQGVELGETSVGYWGNQTGFAYDPLRIKENELPQSWQDVEKYIRENPKKFGYSDPNGGSSGNAFIQRALVYVNGDYDYRTEKIDEGQIAAWKKTWAWFNERKDALIRTASNADSLTRLNDGELIIVSAWQDHLFSLQKQGAITERLKFYVPEFGMPGGGNVLTIAKNAPNPAASLLFVHWITSPETQRKLSQEFGVRPLDSESGKKDTLFFSTPWRKAEMEYFTKEVISR